MSIHGTFTSTEMQTPVLDEEEQEDELQQALYGN